MTSSTLASREAAGATSGSDAPDTPLRQWWRRTSAWVWIGVGLVVLTLASVLLSGSQVDLQQGTPLDPESAGPGGAKALVSVLRDHGVEVQVTENLEDTVETVTGDTTLVVHDLGGLLNESQWQRIRELEVDHLVVLNPGFTARQAFEDVAIPVAMQEAPSETDDEAHQKPLPAGAACGPLGTQAPAISRTQGTLFEPAPGASGCYEGEDEGYALVTSSGSGATGNVSVFGQATVFSNGLIGEHANAGLAMNLLGENAELVWYLPSVADLTGDAGMGAYVPQWLLPATILLAVAGIAAAFAYGRRFGPLVAERLPVAVPANETIEGRARLYGQSGARLRALDAIRIGTIGRIANLANLGSTSDVADVSRACAALARVPLAHAQAVLMERIPQDDRELVELANECAELERRVREAVGRYDPHRDPAPSASQTPLATPQEFVPPSPASPPRNPSPQPQPTIKREGQ